MADSDDLDLDGGDVADSGPAPKKRGGGLGGLIPTILKFAAIGLGALIFIVTVSVITYNIMQKGGKSQTEIADPMSPYVGTRPMYNYFDNIGSITTRTADFPIPATVTVEIYLGVDQDNQAASTELAQRRLEIRDFLRNFFATKTADEMTPQREEELKKQIREQLNTRLLDTAKVRNVLFNRLDVSTEAY